MSRGWSGRAGSGALLQCRPGRGEAGDRDAERGAGHVVHPDLVEQLDRLRVAAVLTTDTGLQAGLPAAALLDADPDQLADTVPVDLGERVGRDDVVVDVGVEERALGVVTRQADPGLGEVVGAEAEVVGVVGDLVGDQSGARQLDHRADRVVERHPAGGDLLVGDPDDDLPQPLELLRVGDQRDHDLHDRLEAALLDRDGGPDDGLGLHVRDLRVEQRQAAAAGAEHRVRLGELLHPGQQRLLLGQFVGGGAGEPELLDLEILLDQAGQELVQRRVEQPDVHRQAAHRLEDRLEVGLLEGQDLGQRRGPVGLVVGQDHPLHGGQPDLIHEHVLGAAQADALGAELARLRGVVAVVGVGPHGQRPHLVGPADDPLEVLAHRRRDQLHRPVEHLAGGAVDGDDVALVPGPTVDREDLVGGVDGQLVGAGDAGPAHAAGDHRRVGGHAAVRGQHALGLDDAVDVVRGGLPADQHDVLTGLAARLGGVGVEDDHADRGARGGVQADGDRLGLGLGVDAGVHQLVQLVGLDPADRLVLVDDALVDQVAGDLDRRPRGALAVAGLQHVELLVLDGELHVLHVPVVLLHPVHGVQELVVGLREDLLHLGQRPGRTDARDDVLALRVGEELPVELLRAGGGVAGEAHPGGGGLAHVAEHHLHHVDGGAELGGDVVGAPVDLGTRVVPGPEDGVHGAAQLLHRVGRPGAAQGLGGELLELGHQLLQVLGAQVGVAGGTLGLLHGGEGVLVDVRGDALDDLAVHLDEAAVGVPREAGVAGLGSQRLDGGVVDAEVEDGVHHAGHGLHGTGPYGDQQRLLGPAERTARTLLEAVHRLLDLAPQSRRPLTGLHGLHARGGGDGERVRDRNPDPVHLGHTGALTTEERLHVSVALGEVVDVAAVWGLISHQLLLVRAGPRCPATFSPVVSR
ncbi:hypothetical protein SDC9_83400 [bioreactor metagenome]|uniref:NAD-specific glutamate dehydrogenase n=1 Tax=bioreactor metagenome TaxID=1076179 RepID=A0A644Z943_9ZZZZ